MEAALAKGYKPERVKITMFEAMEGMAKDHAANIDQYRVLTALEILEGMGPAAWSVNDFPVAECSPLLATTMSLRNVLKLL